MIIRRLLRLRKHPRNSSGIYGNSGGQQPGNRTSGKNGRNPPDGRGCFSLAVGIAQLVMAVTAILAIALSAASFWYSGFVNMALDRLTIQTKKDMDAIRTELEDHSDQLKGIRSAAQDTSRGVTKIAGDVEVTATHTKIIVSEFPEYVWQTEAARRSKLRITGLDFKTFYLEQTGRKPVLIEISNEGENTVRRLQCDIELLMDSREGSNITVEIASAIEETWFCDVVKFENTPNRHVVDFRESIQPGERVRVLFNLTTEPDSLSKNILRIKATDLDSGTWAKAYCKIDIPANRIIRRISGTDDTSVEELEDYIGKRFEEYKNQPLSGY